MILFFISIFTFFMSLSCADEIATIPLQSLPIDYYIQNGLLPKDITPKRQYYNLNLRWTPGEFKYTSSTQCIYYIDMTGAGSVANQGIIIKNTGSGNIQNPWIVLNGEKNWYNVDSILTEILGTETDPEKKAFLIWKFILLNRYHWSPAEGGSEIHDPTKYLNVYGYGFCDDSATNMEALFKRSGFTLARTWGIGGHVIPEVYYNNEWHMLDADLQVFYPKRDNIIVAGVEDCVSDGWLVSRVSGSSIASLYTTTSNNYTYQNAWIITHTMGMILRPGEQLERYWYNWGKYHDCLYHYEPPRYGNGRMLYSPDLSSNIFKKGFQSLTNIETYSDTNTSPNIHLADSTRSGILLCKMSSPYVFVGGMIQLNAYCLGSTDTISVSFSKTGSSWSKLLDINGPTTSTFEISLDSPISPTSSSACYSFFVQFILNGVTKYSVGINDLHICGDIQCAPASLPTLRPAIINTSNVTFSADPGGILEIRHIYNKLTNVYPPSSPDYPVFPKDDGITTTTAPIISWKDSPCSGTIANHDVMVSWDPFGILPTTPLMWKTLGAVNSWQLPDGWLLNEHTYYWRVRIRNNADWGPWGAPWSFTVSLYQSGIIQWTSYK